MADTADLFSVLKSAGVFPTIDAAAMFPKFDTASMFPKGSAIATFPTIDAAAMFPKFDTASMFPKGSAIATFPTIDAAAMFPKFDIASIFPNLNLSAALTDMKLGIANATGSMEPEVCAPEDGDLDPTQLTSLRTIWAEALCAATARADTTAARKAIGGLALVLFCIWWLDMTAYHQDAADVLNVPVSITVPIALAAILTTSKKK